MDKQLSRNVGESSIVLTSGSLAEDITSLFIYSIYTIYNIKAKHKKHPARFVAGADRARCSRGRSALGHANQPMFSDFSELLIEGTAVVLYSRASISKKARIPRWLRYGSEGRGIHSENGRNTAFFLIQWLT